MKTESAHGLASPGRVLEMLSDPFGAFEAIAMASIKLARHVPEDELSMDLLGSAEVDAAPWRGGRGGTPPGLYSLFFLPE